MKTNKLYIIGALCLIIGLIVFVIGFAMLHFDITKLNTDTPYVSKSFVSTKTIRAISIVDNNTDIQVLSSSDDKIHITYYENDKNYYELSESDDGDLVIIKKSNREWYEYFFNIQFGKPTLLVEVPENYNNDMTIQSHDGQIIMEDIRVDDLLLASSDDKIQIENVSASGCLEAKTSDNTVCITNTIVTGDIVCQTSSGKIDLNTVEGKSIKAENADGNITLRSATSKESILLKTSSNTVNLDNVKFNQEFNCTVSDGNVKGSIAGKLADYTVTSKAVDGKNNLPERMSGGDKIINIKTSSGDITIDFTN